MNEFEIEITKLKDRVKFLEESLDKVLLILEEQMLFNTQVKDNFKILGGK